MLELGSDANRVGRGGIMIGNWVVLAFGTSILAGAGDLSNKPLVVNELLPLTD